MTSGSCLCGAVRYELASKIESADHCHCSMCRRFHGSAFATYGRLPRSSFRILQGAQELEPFRSSDSVTRSFCRRCGSSLLFEHATVPDLCFVALGTLDGDPGLRPESHIFVASKAPWFEITDDLPRHDEYPPGVGT
jgi:hypothetical protein